MEKFKCGNCGMNVGEEEKHKSKVIRAYSTICMKCVEQIDNHSKGYAEGYSEANKEIKEFLKSRNPH